MHSETDEKENVFAPFKEVRFLYSFIALIWFLFSIPFLKAEWLCLQQMSSFGEGSSFAKKVFLEGPIYVLAFAAQEATPPHASIALIAPSPDDKLYYELKLHYYLWPRKITFLSSQDLMKSALEKFDYVLALADAEGNFLKSSFFEKIFDLEKDVHYTIYRNNNRVKS